MRRIPASSDPLPFQRRRNTFHLLLTLVFYAVLIGFWLSVTRDSADDRHKNQTSISALPLLSSWPPTLNRTRLWDALPGASTSRDSAPRTREQNFSVPPGYPTLSEFETRFFNLVHRYPQLAKIEKIGRSTVWQQPIWAIRLTAAAHEQTGKPAVLFTALHHAREPAGVFICLAVMNDLLSNYGVSARHTRLLDSLEIWFVPIVNPDGYRYIMESQRNYPWWRKNLRDNNHDGRFDPLVDGVDLNRNYDYNWSEGGENEPSSWFYRGAQAFSEPEIQAVRDLALQKKFVLGVSYHSYGEAVLFPWGNYLPAPDQDLIVDIAQTCAAQIGRLSGRGTYNILPLNGRCGQSSIWMYGELGAIDFIIETGEEYFPSLADAARIAEQNLRGAMYLLERALGAGISGHVVDAETGKPLNADIHVRGRRADYVRPRHANGAWGRFERLLRPGTYTVEISQTDYETARFEKVQVEADRMTPLHVMLRRKNGHAAESSH